METDPRVERTRTAIREALVTLVKEEGLEALTHQRVAESAGVGRATVYRHLPTHEDLVTEAFDCMDASLPLADDETFEAQLGAIAEKMAKDLNDPATRGLLVGMIQRAQCDPLVRRRLSGLIADMLARLREVEGHPDDVDRAVAQVVGALLFRSLVAGKRVDGAFLDEVIRRSL